MSNLESEVPFSFSRVGVRVAKGLLILVAVAIIAVLVGRTLDHVGWIQAFDTSVYGWIQFGPHPHWLDVMIAPFNFNFLPWGGTAIPSFLYFFFIAAAIELAIWHRKEFPWAFLALITAIFISGLMYKVTESFVDRDRPFVHLANMMSDGYKGIWLHWPTYPSGHVRDASLYATVLVYYAKYLRWPLAILIIFIAYSRVYLGAHYPTDVIAGALIGYFSGTAVVILIEELKRVVMYLRSRSKKKPAVTV